MNIVLFEPHEIDGPLPLSDERARHILSILKCEVGDSFDVGVVDGERGKATVTGVADSEILLDFELGIAGPALAPVDLIIGLARPQTNRKILQEATSLGVRSMVFVSTERGEPSYASSKLWSSGEWRRHLVSGSAQAFATRLPRIGFGLSLPEALKAISDNAVRVALDNYEGTAALGTLIGRRPNSDVTLAIGSERGWTEGERALMRGFDFEMAHLGARPLRTETATIAAVSIVLDISRH